MQTIQEQHDIIGAQLNGKAIQCRLHGASDWRDVRPQTYNFSSYVYRLKPEPREFWIQKCPNLESGVRVSETFPQARCSKCLETIHVREVISE